MQMLIDEKRYWEISEKLLTFDTVSYKSDAPCAAYIANLLNSLGFQVKIDTYQDRGVEKQQVLATIGPEVDGGLILSGHIDTVPFEQQSGWEVDPLKLTYKNDRVYGRGTCDMKLFIAQCLYAASMLELKKLKRPLVFVFTSDEETGCHGSARLIDSMDRFLGKVPRPRRAVIGEPTSFEIVDTHKGMGHFELVLKGKAWHSSRPDLGDNAVHKMTDVLQVVQKLNDSYEKQISSQMREAFPDFSQNFLHLAQVKSGEALNMVPDEAVLGFSFRSFPFDKPMRVLEDFQEALSQKLKAGSYEVRGAFSAPPMRKADDPELLETLKACCEAKESKSVSFATDGGNFSQMGIETFIWGPGDIQMAHRPNEYMLESDFHRGPHLIKQLIEKSLY